MKCNYLLTLLGILGILFSSVKVSDAQMTVAKIDQQPVEKQAENGVRFFEGSWEQALAEAKSTGKPIFMDCYTSWCVPCKMLATTVFTKKEVGDYFNSHFINVKMDMESKEGKTLNKQYEILGYPTLLFIDGGGNMFHRIVGTTPAEILLKEAARALDGNGYSVMKKKYGEGNRQPDFIQEYMEVLSVAGEDKVAARVCVDYFNTLEKSRLKEPEYWKLFQKYVKDVDAGISKYMYKNREEFITLFGEKEVNRKLYQLYSEGAYRYWKDDVFDTKGFDRYTSQLMKTDLKQREQIIDEARMYYAMKTNNWQEYIRLGNERIKKGLNDDFMIYNWGLKVNVLCKDMVLREEAAKWLDVIAANCDKKPNDKDMAALKNTFLGVADKLRHPEKNDKNYRPTINISGKVAALREGEDMIRVIKKEGFFKEVVDSCAIKSDGTYELKMRVATPGVYILECQGGQRVEFWAGTEDLSVDFPGFGNAKFKVVRPSYYPIRGGKDNEVMNALNWEVFQMYEMLTKVPVPIREYISLADSVKRQLAVEVADIVSGDLPNRLQYWAELYADREAVIAILKALEKNEYAEMVKKIAANLSKLYPTSTAVKEFQEVLTQKELSGQGQVAPEFACPTPDGKKNMGPQDFRGKILVMDFWASWCGPCRAEIPHLKEAYAKYGDKGVAFFSVSIDKSDAAWKKALGEENMPWEQVCAPQAGKDVMRLYQFSGIPYVLVLDKEGRIVGTNLRGQALMDKLEELVNGSNPKAAKSSMMMVR